MELTIEISEKDMEILKEVSNLGGCSIPELIQLMLDDEIPKLKQHYKLS